MTTKQKPWEIVGISRASYFRHKRSQTHYSLIKEFEHYLSAGISEVPKSQDYKIKTIQRLEFFFSSIPLVNVYTVRHYLQSGTYSQKKDRHSALSAFCRFLVSKQLMDEAELSVVKKLYPKRSRYYQPKQLLLNHDQINKITSHCDIALFLSETGLRISEYCALTSDCLNYSSIPSQAAVFVKNGKGGKSRLVPFSKRAQGTMLDFTYTRHSLDKHFRQVAILSNVKFSSHSFRHYRLTQWANNARIPITTVQKWAGHADIKTTMKYVHINDEEAMLAAFE